jgi:hypothetical protein
MIFTCLSHDIIAHETTHALLDGMHRRYAEDNNKDALAFHEAFADIVALFQHFTFPEVLRHQISQTRGDLTEQSLLGELAQQFGEATGCYGALRSAIGAKDAEGKWQPLKPDPTRLKDSREPHIRGSILVAAIFGAFLDIYKMRVRDLIRLATAGTGELPAGEIHPDLVDRLAREANKTAGHFLNICIRALDYCPPFDVTLGEYLRALVTADFDMVPDDGYGYRVAIIDSFRRWGIIPPGLRTLSEDQLRWPFSKMLAQSGWSALTDVANKLRPAMSSTLYVQDRRELFDSLVTSRISAHQFLAEALTDSSDLNQRDEFTRVTGIDTTRSSTLDGIRKNKETGQPTFEVHAVRPALRVSPDGTIMKQMIMIVTQRREVLIDPDNADGGKFDFRGGSTLIFDLDGNEPSLRYAITRSIADEQRLAEIRAYRKAKSADSLTLRETYFGPPKEAGEPFALLHSEE